MEEALMKQKGIPVKVVFAPFSALLGYLVGGQILHACIGLGVASILILIDLIIQRDWLKIMFICYIGMTLGLVGAALIIFFIGSAGSKMITPYFTVPLAVALGYGGAMTVYRYRGNLRLVSPPQKTGSINSQYKVLDTSVIIDGRIADICKTQFIEGILIVPRFVLRELQHIADSLDVLRRNKGRRGLDKLRELQENPDIDVQIVDEDFPEIKEVDAKLIMLAKEVNAKIITNDFNLNKVAELQGVTVLNINDLANALKPIVLPGEPMTVKVIKEGKEFNQGVAYLDDGTMVVVENGREYVGQTVQVEVTTTLQTAAGRMIFTRINNGTDDQTQLDQHRDRNGDISSYTRGWTRRENGR
jgi:uncharacterized protein YacL